MKNNLHPRKEAKRSLFKISGKDLVITVSLSALAAAAGTFAVIHTVSSELKNNLAQGVHYGPYAGLSGSFNRAVLTWQNCKSCKTYDELVSSPANEDEKKAAAALREVERTPVGSILVRGARENKVYFDSENQQLQQACTAGAMFFPHLGIIAYHPLFNETEESRKELASGLAHESYHAYQFNNAAEILYKKSRLPGKDAALRTLVVEAAAFAVHFMVEQELAGTPATLEDGRNLMKRFLFDPAWQLTRQLYAQKMNLRFKDYDMQPSVLTIEDLRAMAPMPGMKEESLLASDISIAKLDLQLREDIYKDFSLKQPLGVLETIMSNGANLEAAVTNASHTDIAESKGCERKQSEAELRKTAAASAPRPKA